MESDNKQRELRWEGNKIRNDSKEEWDHGIMERGGDGSLEGESKEEYGENVGNVKREYGENIIVNVGEKALRMERTLKKNT